jgi:hypothetical protein
LHDDRNLMQWVPTMGKIPIHVFQQWY